MISLEKATALIAQHEGFRDKCYRDTRGFLTIGYGFNLDAPGAEGICEALDLNYQALRYEGLGPDEECISEPLARLLLNHAVQRAMDVAVIIVPGLAEMPENVQLVVVDMIYNLGSKGFGEFHGLLAALKVGDRKAAAVAMEDSLWYRQVGLRGKHDVALMLQAA